jgi:hypothetical protein
MVSSTLFFYLYPYFASHAILFGNSECYILPMASIDVYAPCSYRRTYMPSSYHIVQELQKYNIPDYRPRQEQLVLYFNKVEVQNLIRYCCTTGFKRRSKRYALCNGCAGTAALLSVKPKLLENKTRQDSSVPMIRQSQMLDLVDISLFSLCHVGLLAFIPSDTRLD